MVRQILFTDMTYKRHERFRTGYIHRVTYQGSYLHWDVAGPDELDHPRGLRGKVTCFSKRSRMRLLCKCAAIDWRKSTRTLFVTLTFPDLFVDTPGRKMSQYLHVFRRGIENYLDKQISILWRIEWMPRQTGARINYLFPHFHLLIFAVRYIPYVVVNNMWKAALGYRKYCRTETEAMRSKWEAIHYVSKYLAKTNGSLVYGPYLNTEQDGRRWGILREELFPYGDKWEGNFPDTLDLEHAYAWAKSLLPRKKQRCAASFRLFGHNAESVGQLLYGVDVDGQEHTI